MYAGYGFRSFEIGDVDVLWHDGLFHLFHLVLPNHDYIAHAVSEDGLTWRRVENALFISDPGAFDDDMLWTMHVSPDPHRGGGWRMFYTGLNMGERGRVQRIGLARSDDLYAWRKIGEEDGFPPLEAEPGPYEASLEEGRGWVSFRDPFWLEHEGRRLLLAAARVPGGPTIRRGCVALMEEVAPDRFEARAPLHHPGRYDDVEVPGLLRIGGRLYLIGSIREDVKVHYWYADRLEGPWRNHFDNVLLPRGNYAARVCHDERHDVHYVWNFFFRGSKLYGEHLLPPPKELEATERGELRLRSYRGFDERVTGVLRGEALGAPEPLSGHAGTTVERVERLEADDGGPKGGGSEDGGPKGGGPKGGGPKGGGRGGGASEEGAGEPVWRLGCSSGFETFLLPGEHRDFRLSLRLAVEGSGKCGLVAQVDDEGDGYHVSLDLVKGLAQIRAWGDNPDGGIEEAFHYDQLQANYFVPHDGVYEVRLLAYGTYLELSLDGDVVLSLADDAFRSGRCGVYVEGAAVRIGAVAIETLHCPPNEPYRTMDPADPSREAQGAGTPEGTARTRKEERERAGESAPPPRGPR